MLDLLATLSDSHQLSQTIGAEHLQHRELVLLET